MAGDTPASKTYGNIYGKMCAQTVAKRGRTMVDKTWKAIERKICARFGGERSGPTGRTGPDCINTEPFALQIKHRKSVPQWLTDAYAQSMRDAPSGCLAVLVLHPHGWSIDESMAIVPLGQFVDWYVGDTKPQGY